MPLPSSPLHVVESYTHPVVIELSLEHTFRQMSHIIIQCVGLDLSRARVYGHKGDTPGRLTPFAFLHPAPPLSVGLEEI